MSNKALDDASNAVEAVIDSAKKSVDCLAYVQPHPLIKGIQSIFYSTAHAGACDPAKVQKAAKDIADSAGKALSNGNNKIGFSKGTGDAPFHNKSRSQHASRHLNKAGILPNWNNATYEKFKEIGQKVLENPIKTFDHTLRDGTSVKGFYGKVAETDVVFHVYKDGKYATQIATSVVPSPQQLTNWGLK